MHSFTAAHETSSFDVILSGVIPPPCFSHTSELLEEFARILRPSGLLYLVEPVTTGGITIRGIMQQVMYVCVFQSTFRAYER